MSDTLDRDIAKAAMKWRAAVLGKPRDHGLHVRRRRELEKLCDQGLRLFKPAEEAPPSVPSAEGRVPAGGTTPWWDRD